jgi:hypothetical protein
MGGASLMMAMVLGLSTPAFADEADPQVTVEADGTVLCRMTVPASEAQIRSLLEDPESAAMLSPDVIDIDVTANGNCHNLETRSRGFLRPLVLNSKRCPTADGWREVLVSSGDFTQFEGEWHLQSVEGGTEIVYTLQTGTNLPVPDSVVRQGAAKSLKNMLKNLSSRL